LLFDLSAEEPFHQLEYPPELNPAVSGEVRAIASGASLKANSAGKELLIDLKPYPRGGSQDVISDKVTTLRPMARSSEHMVEPTPTGPSDAHSADRDPARHSASLAGLDI
jgi:hypothetical protein